MYESNDIDKFNTCITPIDIFQCCCCCCILMIMRFTYSLWIRIEWKKKKKNRQDSAHVISYQLINRPHVSKQRQEWSNKLHKSNCVEKTKRTAHGARGIEPAAAKGNNCMRTRLHLLFNKLLLLLLSLTPCKASPHQHYTNLQPPVEKTNTMAQQQHCK